MRGNEFKQIRTRESQRANAVSATVSHLFDICAGLFSPHYTPPSGASQGNSSSGVDAAITI